MADYGADPGGFKSDSYGMSQHELTLAYEGRESKKREDKLRKELEELKAEIRVLKGIKTYQVEVSRKAYYLTDAASADEARSWYYSTGVHLVPNGQMGAETVEVKEKND